MARIIRSPEKEKAHRKKIRILSVVVFLCLAVFLWLVTYIPSLPSLQIKNILVRGNKVLMEEEIKQEINKELSGKYLYFFPETNIFLYPQERTENILSQVFPRIATVSTHLDTERIITVSLTEREPFALWCGREMSATPPDDACAYLDDTGFVFAKAPHFSGNTYFEFYGKGILPEGDVIGHVFLPPASLQAILKVKEELESFHMHPVKIVVAGDGHAEFLEAGGYGVRFNLDQDMSVLRLNMQAVFRSGSWGGTAASDGLEYLDFRFGNKVYYKYKNEEGG